MKLCQLNILSDFFTILVNQYSIICIFTALIAIFGHDETTKGDLNSCVVQVIVNVPTCICRCLHHILQYPPPPPLTYHIKMTPHCTPIYINNNYTWHQYQFDLIEIPQNHLTQSDDAVALIGGLLINQHINLG